MFGTKMSTKQIDEQKLSSDIQMLHPRRKKPENLANVLLAGHRLDAVEHRRRKTRWKFVLNGAKPHAVLAAFDEGLLERQRAPDKRILKSDRGKIPKDENALRGMLHIERQRLYDHLSQDRLARLVVLRKLKLSRETDGLEAIHTAMEAGSLPKQIYVYDNVVRALKRSKLYSRRWGYLWMGFWKLPHTYWLSKAAIDLLGAATI